MDLFGHMLFNSYGLIVKALKHLSEKNAQSKVQWLQKHEYNGRD